jgi:hypothetical protein
VCIYIYMLYTFLGMPLVVMNPVLQDVALEFNLSFQLLMTICLHFSSPELYRETSATYAKCSELSLSTLVTAAESYTWLPRRQWLN